MNQDDLSEIVKTLSKFLLQNQALMAREEDLKNLYPNESEFPQVISLLYEKFKEIGIELITSKFHGEKYYILTMEGKDKEISPEQYGILALLIAYSKEFDENMNLKDVKEIFSDVWETDIQFLINKDYMRISKLQDLEMIEITPLGKALLKNIVKDLQLKNLLEIFEK
ncbi:MAG: hypothetical protein ACTSU4_04300 [Promethearchaeota archaeon]